MWREGTGGHCGASWRCSSRSPPWPSAPAPAPGPSAVWFCVYCGGPSPWRPGLSPTRRACRHRSSGQGLVSAMTRPARCVSPPVSGRWRPRWPRCCAGADVLDARAVAPAARSGFPARASMGLRSAAAGRDCQTTRHDEARRGRRSPLAGKPLSRAPLHRTWLRSPQTGRSVPVRALIPAGSRTGRTVRTAPARRSA